MTMAELRSHAPWVMALSLVLGLLLLATSPQRRSSVRNALLLLGACALVLLAEAATGATRAHALLDPAADAATAVVGLVAIRLATIFAFAVVLPALRASPPRIATDLITAVLCLAWVFAWLRVGGVDPASLVTTSAVITAVLAFSMQETLGNLLGGIVLQLDSSMREGDWVRVEDVSGRVAEITWRHTAIETRNGETVVIPNGWLMKNRLTVISPGGRPWRRWIRLNVDLSASPSRVCTVLESAVLDAAIPNVSADPKPSAVLMEMGARQGSYALRYWLADPRPDDATDSLVRIHVVAALARNGMKLAAPYNEQLEIKDNEAHRQADRASEQERRLAALGQAEIFESLSAAERLSLADHLVYAPFAAGDVITRQGATAHWLYLVVSGDADVWIDAPGGGRKEIATLHGGEVFGEMGMMTGAPRSASVSARTDVICYRLDKEGFGSIIKARPDIAEAISGVLARRQDELHALGAHAEAGQPDHSAAILAKIRDFFGL